MLIWKFFTCLLVILTISIITDTHGALLKCKEPVKRFRVSKIKHAKARIIYYNNSIATFNIIWSGDIEQNQELVYQSQNVQDVIKPKDATKSA